MIAGKIRYFRKLREKEASIFVSVSAGREKLEMASLCRQKPFVAVITKNTTAYDAIQVRCQGLVSKMCRACEDGYANLDLALLMDADVVIGEPKHLSQSLLYSPNLKWYSCLFAGVDAIVQKVDPAKGPPPVIVSRSTVNYGAQMADYTIGHIITRELHFQQIWKDQLDKTWSPNAAASAGRVLEDLTIGILGATGRIGSEIAKKCKAMGMTVLGLSRAVHSDPPPYFDCLRPSSQLTDLLSACDYVCNVLPSTPDTRGLLDGDVLRACQSRHSVLISIGRGDIASEESLLNALRKEWLGGAVLDVFPQEPLPVSSALWDTEGVTITPHCAGIVPSGNMVAEEFYDNLKLYLAGETPINSLDWKTGY